MKHVLTVLMVFGSTLALPPSSSKQYRDYVYNRRTDAFYKLHPESRYKVMAEHICTSEGTKLMVPSTPEDIAQVHGLLKSYPDIGDKVFVGNDGTSHDDAGEVPIIDLSNTEDDDNWHSISECDVLTRKGEVDSTQCYMRHPFVCKVTARDAPYDEQCDVYATGMCFIVIFCDDLISKKVASLHSISECDVITRKGEVDSTQCYMRHPFVCKVTARDAPYDEQCDVYATGYKYYDDVKSCYKVPEVALAWEEALSACAQENAHLVVINSQAESDRLKEFLRTAPRLTDAVQTYFFHAGIRANMPTDGSQRVFKTIFNQTLEEAGFSSWSTGEPNNYNSEEYCGTIFSSNGLYNDVNCDLLFGFICEKEVAHA